jgi:hypothetical protein
LSFLAAWYGIEEADNENSCRVSNSTEDCIPAISLISSNESLAEALTGRLPDFNYDLYLFWMAGATVCGLVWACINVLTLVFLNEVIRTHLVLLDKVEKELADG